MKGPGRWDRWTGWERGDPRWRVDVVRTDRGPVSRTAAALTDATRAVICSNQIDFFEDFESTHGGQLESFSGGFGNEWDLYTASLAAVSAGMRRAIEKLRAAEALAAVASLVDPLLLDGRADERELAHLRMGMYYEHDWTADGPVSRAQREAFQRECLAVVKGYVDALYDDALASLAASIPAAPGEQRHLVFNPLSFGRDAVVDLPDFPMVANT